MEVEITEFEEITPEEVHLVKRGANGFPPLLAKQVADEIAAAADGEDLAAKADKACPTCKGSGKIREGHVTCPDCKGSGKQPASDDADDQDEDSAEKAVLSDKDRSNMDESQFAYVDAKGGKHLPIHDPAHVRAALGRFGSTKFDTPADKKKAAEAILAAAKKFDISVSGDTDVTAAAKSVPVLTGANPLFAAAPAADASVPGSPTWEATDADTATEAAQQLMAAADLIRTFAGREAAEFAAGEGNDLFDAYDAEQALDLVTCALGIMARLAFIEGAAAEKSVAKAGKVLSSKSVDAIRAAVKALNDLLASAAGGSNPGGDDAAKSTKETLEVEITTEALADMVAKAATEAVAATAKSAKSAAKAQEREAKKAAKAEADANMTDEERAAKRAARDEKKAAKAAEKEAKKAEKPAAPVTADEISETVVKSVVEALRPIADRLSTVEKMAAPGGPVKTRTPGTLAKSEQRDALELAASELERRADSELDAEVRKGLMDRAKAARDKIAALPAA